MQLLAEYRYDGIYHIEFEFKNKKCIALMTEDKSKRNGKTVLKTEYFGAFPDLQNEMVKRGYTLIFIENRNRWGTPEQIEDQYEFIAYASKELGISSKVITIGSSINHWPDGQYNALHCGRTDCHDQFANWSRNDV